MAVTRRDPSARNGASPPPLTEELRGARQEARDLGFEAGAILAEFRELARLELGLARAEAMDSMQAARQSAMFGGVAAVMALIGLVFLSLAATFALDLIMPAWLAALIVAGVLLVITAIAGSMARSRMKQVSVVPTHTIESVKEDVRWAREQIKQNSV